MSRVWFAGELETVATFWQVLRRDGVALGFTSHDRDLWFAGLLHRAAPGMVPSAIRRSADVEPDSAEVQGALSHAAISAEDLVAGKGGGLHDAHAHGVDQAIHFVVTLVVALGDAVETQGARCRTATLVQRGDEAGCRGHFVQHLRVHHISLLSLNMARNAPN